MVEFIQRVPLGVFLFLCLMPGVFLLTGVVQARREWKRSKAIFDVKVSSIGDVARGLVAIEGRVEELLTGPVSGALTGKPCCWYSAKVEKRERRRKTKGETGPVKGWTWRLKEEFYCDMPLLVTDRTATCAVWAAGVEAMTAHRSIWYGETPKPMEGPPEDEVQEEPSDAKFRYVEERLLAGDEVYAFGEITREVDYADTKELRAALPPGVKHLVWPFSQPGRLVLSQGSRSDAMGAATMVMKQSLSVAGIGAAGVVGLLLVRFGVIG